MDSLDLEVIKKEIVSKVDRLGDDYTTFSYANKLIVFLMKWLRHLKIVLINY